MSPSPTPMPIRAMPMSCMMVRTSAKSRLIMPGTVIRSEIPCTAWRSTSSQTLNACMSGVFRSSAWSSRSLGMVMTVSTQSFRSLRPISAWEDRRRPSKVNGLVTTAMVSAPSSDDSDAMMGAAPVPVPPPSPAVMNTMSAPSSCSMIRSVSSSAAARPTSGLAPAPRPLVSLPPSCSLIWAALRSRACRSVLAAMNSIPSTRAWIIRLTALQPPPPTPTTLILAPTRPSSSNVNRRFGTLFMPSMLLLLQLYAE